MFSVQLNGILQCHGHKVHGWVVGGAAPRAKSGDSSYEAFETVGVRAGRERNALSNVMATYFHSDPTKTSC